MRPGLLTTSRHQMVPTHISHYKHVHHKAGTYKQVKRHARIFRESRHSKGVWGCRTPKVSRARHLRHCIIRFP